VGGPSALAADEAGDGDRLPDPCRPEETGRGEALEAYAVGRIHDEAAADHGHPVIGLERPRHDDLTLNGRVSARNDVPLVKREAERQRALTVA
jgi:hypothetical protein